MSHPQAAFVTKIEFGIDARDRKQIVDGWFHLLADTYTLFPKVHCFLWNVIGSMFNTLHTMFMTQYNQLWLSLDEIAEPIRALDHPAPASGGKESGTPGRNLALRAPSTAEPRRWASSGRVLPWSYYGDTVFLMKVAISLPDPVFAAAERLAGELHVSRSQLYAQALAQYLERFSAPAVTAKLNAVYGREASTLDPAFAQAQSTALSNEAW